MKALTMAVFALLVTSCAFMRTVRQEDLDAWRGQPVELLDAHPIFAAMDMRRTVAESGVETRNYRNAGAARVTGSAKTTYQRGSSDTTFTGQERQVVCNNVFVIRAGRVVSYTPVGQCFTDERVRPQN